MAISIKSLGLDQLGPEERLSLAEQLWDSIAADSEAVPLTGPQRVELDRRLADHETDGPLPITSLPSPEISVLNPTSTPATSVIALNGPVVPSNGIPISRARGSAA
jgi:putative addiction module component (TIGR02574 family)